MDALAYTFDHIHLYCTDPAATERWLIEGMGGELEGRGELKGTPFASVRLGGASILVRGPRAGEVLGEPGPSRFGNDHFGLLVRDIGATVEELRCRGVEIEIEPYEIRPGMKVAFVRGPDLVRVELLQKD